MIESGVTSQVATDSLIQTLTLPSFIADPYPTFAGWRAEPGPLRLGSNIWLVSRYADVAEGARSRELSCDFASLDTYADYFESRGVDRRLPLPLNALDPPDHRRVRSVIGTEFLPASVARIQPMVERIAMDVVADVRGRAGASFDLVEEVSYPVPVAIIGELFGIPRADHALLWRWSEAFGQASDPDPLLTDEQRKVAADATGEAGEYFGRLVLRRRRDPGDDILSRWLAVSRREGTMSIPELLVNGVFLLIVGHHNTVSLISSGLLALLQHPDQMALLRADLSLMPNAVEELLRYDSPVQTATRITVKPHQVHGGVIPPRQQVMFVIGSANRDPGAFPDPDTLDIRRRPAERNLGFGMGMHACIGAELAKVEVAATLKALLLTFDHIEQDGPVVRRRPCFTLRGPSRFPIRVA